LSKEGKDFLAGKIDADQYMQGDRRRVENMAVREVNEHVGFRSTGLFRTWVYGAASVAYAFLAVQDFFQSKDRATAALALGTAIFTGTLAVVRLRSRRRFGAKRAPRT
jgi:uncharacterized membrane protein YgdD (TMEM256/DUF423 family)